MTRPKILLFISIFALIYLGLVLFLSVIDATKSLAVAIVGAATMVGATGVVVAFASIESYRQEAKLQRTYEIIDSYVDEEFKIAERYLKYSFSKDLNSAKFDFSRGLSSSKGAKVQIYNQSIGGEMSYEINFLIQKVSNFYSNLGIMAAYDMVDSDIIYINLGTDLLILWDLLRPIIALHDTQRRNVREPRLLGFHSGWRRIPYQAGFAYLAQTFEKAAPSSAACRLMIREYYGRDNRRGAADGRHKSASS